VKAFERRHLNRADAIVMLTEAGLRTLRQRRAPLPPHRVIPTCTDLSAYTPRGGGQTPEYGLVYSGSLGTWYMTREMVDFARIASERIPGRVLFLTRQVVEARRAGVSADWAELRSATPAEVPVWLRNARAVFFFITPTPAKQASCPTKLGEALATGLPIVTNLGVGDIDATLEREGVGVLVDSFSPDGYRRAADRLHGLLRDPGTAARCRHLAETRYSLESAVTAYHQLYLKASEHDWREGASASSSS
jgi:hypothetical protein